MKKYICLFILIVYYSTSIWGETFKNMSIREGLSSRQVFQIEKDAQGFIWAYTSAGIDRYDGNEIKHYTLDHSIGSKNHLHSSSIMTCSPTGELWIGLKNGKVYAYDQRTDSFLLKNKLQDALPSYTLNNLSFDSTGQLWLCTGNGIYTMYENTPTLTGLKGEYIYCMVQQNDTTFFAGTDRHVYRLQKTTDGFIETQLDIPEVRAEVLMIANDKLYIGTFANSIIVFNLETGHHQSLNKFIPNAPVRAFAMKSPHSLFVASDGGGLFEIDTRNEKVIAHDLTTRSNQKDINTVSDICIDSEGFIWLSTSTNGINYLSPHLPTIQRISHIPNNNNSLKSDHVNTIYQDSRGDLWFGTNNGASHYQVKDNRWTHYLCEQAYDNRVVLAFAEDNQGCIYIGGYGFGIYCIQPKTGLVHKLPKRENGNPGIASDHIYTILKHGDDLWFGGIEGELTHYSPQTNEYSYYINECIGDLKTSTDGTLLIAGCEGLGYLPKSEDKIQWKRQLGSLTLNYPIRSILCTNRTIWMATDGDGLLCYYPQNDSIQTYTLQNGLSSNSINSLLEDYLGRIWFTTEKSLYCLNPKDQTLINANDFLDIDWGYYNPNAAYKSSDGSLLFGTAEGVICIQPSLDFSIQDSLHLILTDFKLDYKSIQAGDSEGILKNSIDQTSCIQLKHDQNSFSIGFSAINYKNPKRIRYEYRLEGYTDWNTLDDIQDIHYTNVPSGEYTFQLQAFDKYSGKSMGIRQLKIEICQPFWLSGWAWCSYLLIGAIFIYLIYQYWKQRETENRIQEKINTFINIAHDIRTPVTLIKAPLSDLQNEESLPENSRRSIAVATRNVDKLLSMVTQLLDLQKAEFTSDSLEVTTCDISSYLKEKETEFEPHALQKGISIILELDPKLTTVHIDRRKMDHIIDNLLSNALKYTQEGSIRITTTDCGKKWELRCTDTGIGIPQKEQKHIFREFFRAKNAQVSETPGSGIGLMITRKLVQQHLGQISFHSTEGDGTTFMLRFPKQLKQDENMSCPSQPISMDNHPTIPKTTDKRNVLLLAEDDNDTLEFLTECLSAEYQVIRVSDGKEALETAQTINPDIIISDVVMPGLSGDELCRKLKSDVATSHIPIILLTALCERENIIWGLEAGANDYITKPFDLSVLKARIRNILQSRQHLRNTMLEMKEHPEETDYTSQLDKEFMEKVMETIHKELANSELSINDFCQMLNMSRTSVYNKIKALTGQGPNDFIRIVRLNKSKELLLTRRYTIAEVATLVGYSDPKYFSTSFKKQFGISPSKI